MRRVGRIAFRVEGNTWVAYWTLLDSIDVTSDAIWLGAIHMALVQDESRRRAFMELVNNAVLEIVPDMVGADPMPEVQIAFAPEQIGTA